MSNKVFNTIEEEEDTLTDITFCLPVYNVSRYVSDCIDSILSEIKGMNVEIICIDDCSTDDSWEILNKICAHNNNCFCFKNNSNRGVSYTRNRALDLARGKYIWFIAPDDLLYPGVVKSFLECAEREAADIILGNYMKVEESFSLRSDSLSQENSIVFAKTKEMILPSDNFGNKMCAVWSGMFRSSFLIDNKLLKLPTPIRCVEP